MKRQEHIKNIIKRFSDKPIEFHESSEVIFLEDSVLVLKISAENNKLRFENAQLNEEIEKLKERMNRNLRTSDKTVFGMRETMIDTINITADVLIHNRELREKVEKLEAELKEMKTIWE